MARGSHSFTCHQHVYPRMEWAILHTFRKHSPDGVARARWRTYGSAYYSSIDPERMKGWVGLGGWLHTEIKCRLYAGVEPRHVAHPITNRARRRVTSLIRSTWSVATTPRRHAAYKKTFPTRINARLRCSITYVGLHSVAKSDIYDCFVIWCSALTGTHTAAYNFTSKNHITQIIWCLH